jgi:putative endonuclease
MTFWAYMLRCSDNTFYVGHTDNLEQRIGQHQTGHFPGYTHKRRPVTLVWSEAFGTRLEAKEAEHRLKGWSRPKKLALINGDWELVHLLSRNWQVEDLNRPSTGSGLRSVEDQSNQNNRSAEFVEARLEKKQN